MSQIAPPTGSEQQDAPVIEPDYGAYGAAFPLWAAKEAKEMIIKRLDAQNTSLSAYEARATSWLGWLSGIVIATLTTGAPRLASISHGPLSRIQIAFLMLSVLFPAILSMTYLAAVFRKKKWYYNYGDIDHLTVYVPENPSELEILQAYAEAGRESMQKNDQLLHQTFSSLTSGKRWFMALPVVATITCFVLAAWAWGPGG